MYNFEISTDVDMIRRPWEKYAGLLGTRFSAPGEAYGWNESIWAGCHDWSLRHARSASTNIYRIQKPHKTCKKMNLAIFDAFCDVFGHRRCFMACGADLYHHEFSVLSIRWSLYGHVGTSHHRTGCTENHPIEHATKLTQG